MGLFCKVAVNCLFSRLIGLPPARTLLLRRADESELIALGIGPDEVEHGIGVGALGRERSVAGLGAAGRDQAELGAVTPDRGERRLVGDEVPSVTRGPAQL